MIPVIIFLALVILATIGSVWVALNYEPERPPSQGVNDELV